MMGQALLTRRSGGKTKKTLVVVSGNTDMNSSFGLLSAVGTVWAHIDLPIEAPVTVTFAETPTANADLAGKTLRLEVGESSGPYTYSYSFSSSTTSFAQKFTFHVQNTGSALQCVVDSIISATNEVSAGCSATYVAQEYYA